MTVEEDEGERFQGEYGDECGGTCEGLLHIFMQGDDTAGIHGKRILAYANWEEAKELTGTTRTVAMSRQMRSGSRGKTQLTASPSYVWLWPAR